MTRAGADYELATTGTTGFTFAARSCSELKVDPQVLQRHPVMGVRAAFATFIRDGLKDKANSPPHCKHKCLGKRPLFWGGRQSPTRDQEPRVGYLILVYRTCTFSACRPFGPLTTSNCTA